MRKITIQKQMCTDLDRCFSLMCGIYVCREWRGYSRAKWVMLMLIDFWLILSF